MRDLPVTPAMTVDIAGEKYPLKGWLGFTKQHWFQAETNSREASIGYIFVPNPADVYFFGSRDLDFWIGSRNQSLSDLLSEQ